MSDEATIVAKNYPMLVVGVMLAMTMQMLDTTITIVAVPHMQTTLNASADSITWVLTSYIITSAVAMPITGWLADHIGTRRLFLWSVGGFIVASIFCGMAQNLEEMVLFRGIQGVAGAFIAPLSQSSMIDATRPSKRPQIMALWGMGVVMGPILGPIIGGLLTQNFNWRWVFYVNVPVGLVAFSLIYAQLPDRERRHRPFDLAGFVLIGITLSALQLMLDRGPRLDWFDSFEIWLYLGVAISAAWMAVVHLATARHPLFDRGLFKDMNLITAFIFTFMTGLILFSSMALLPGLLENIMGYDVVKTGMLLAVRGVGVLMSMQIAGYLMRFKVDTRALIGFGLLITSSSLWMMAHWSLDVEPLQIALPGLIQGLGIGLVFIPLNISAFATLQPHLRTDASSLMNLFRSIGSSLGVSVLTAILTRNFQAAHSDIGSHVTSTSTDMIDLSTIDRFQEFGGTVLSFADGIVNRQAALVAYTDDFVVMFWLAISTVPLVLLIRKPQRQ